MGKPSFFTPPSAESEPEGAAELADDEAEGESEEAEEPFPFDELQAASMAADTVTQRKTDEDL
nr:hypothetical protein [Cohnella zeiphila]